MKRWLVPLALVVVVFLFAIFQYFIISQLDYSKAGEHEEIVFPRLPSHVRPIHYEIYIRVDIENFKFEGREIVQLSVSEETRFVKLHADVNVTSVTLYDDNGYEIENITHVKEDFFFVIGCAKVLPPGRYFLALQFHSSLSDGLSGFYRSAYKNDEQNTRHGAVTHFEPASARKAFPCWDEPSFKAQFTITLDVHRQYTALSNMPNTKVSAHDERKNVTFEKTPMMSAYLVAFSVFATEDFAFNESQTVRGIPVRVYARAEKANSTRVGLETTVKALEFFEKYFDFENPLPKVDLVVVPDFTANAMENWGLVVYRETSFFFDESSSDQDKRDVVLLCAHEIAHFWFGNLVTMDWWKELWLKEGFVTYFAYLFANDYMPELDFHSNVLVQREAVIAQDSLFDSQSVQVPLYKPEDLNCIYGPMTYLKAAEILRMIDYHLEWTHPKRDVFRRAMRNIIRRHKYGNINSTDLWEELNEFSGENIGAMFSPWIQQVGLPVVFAQEDFGEQTMALKQSRFLASGHADPKNTTWSIPLEKLNLNHRDESMEMVFRGKTFKLVMSSTAADPSWLNPDQNGLYLVHYSEENFKRVLGVFHDRPAADRYGLLSNTFALVKAGLYPTEILLNFIPKIRKDDSPVVVQLLVEVLQTIRFWLREATDEGKTLNRFDAYVKLLFEEFGDENPAFLEILADAGDPITIEALKTQFEDPELSGNTRPLVYRTVADSGIDGFRNIAEIYESTESRAALVAMGRVTKHGLISELFSSIKGGHVRRNDIHRALSGLSSCSAHAEQETVWRLFVDSFSVMTTGYGGASSDAVLDTVTSLLKCSTNSTVVGELAELYPSPKSGKIVRFLDRIEEMISNNKRQRELKRDEAVNEWLDFNFRLLS